MAIQSSGNPISTSDINVEIGKAATALISLNDTDVRRLMELPSGEIAMGNAYGKSYRFTQTISANTSNLNLRAYAIANGWDQQANIIITINPNIEITSVSTSSSALVIDGAWPKGVTLINNGVIAGKGGTGGGYPKGAGGAGGTAIFSNTNITITNNGIIGGGGGGGGGPPGGYSGLRFSGGGGAGYGLGGGPVSNGTAGSPGTLLYGGPDTIAPNGTTNGWGGDLGTAGKEGDYVIVFGVIGGVVIFGGGGGGAAGLAVSGNNYITWAKTGTIRGARV